MSVAPKRTRGRPRAFHGTPEGTLIQSLDRGMSVLKVVAAGGGMSLSEIADASGQSASTLYRVLVTLQTHGIVAFDEATQLWYVGLEAFRIGSAFLGRASIAEQSRAAMHDVMAATGETANLAIIDRGDVVFVSQVETHEPIRAFFRPGTKGPVHASGIGKAIVAFLPRPAQDAIIGGRDFAAFTGRTIVEEAALFDELGIIRARGWSIDDEEHTLGMRCIAAPVFNAFGEAIAGISVSGPSVRVTPDRDNELGELVRSAANDITRAMGGRLPTDSPQS